MKTLHTIKENAQIFVIDILRATIVVITAVSLFNFYHLFNWGKYDEKPIQTHRNNRKNYNAETF